MTTTQIERVIPLKEAASRMGISVAALTRLVSDGMIRAVQLPDGSMAVSEQATEQDIPQEEIDELRGQPITVRQAVERYGIPEPTIRVWVQRQYITVLKPGYGMQLDHADVAKCVAVYRRNKQIGSRAPLFDEAGRPYELKYPDVAEYRRRKKRSAGTARRPTSPAARVARAKSGRTPR